MRLNPLLLTDSYKCGHWNQYPPKTQKIYSYFESRGGEHDSTVFFGLQYLLQEYVKGQFVTSDDLTEANDICSRHFGGRELLNLDGWQHIINAHGGNLPVRICAVPEGTVVPTGNVLMTIENTDENVPWLTNWLETLLVQAWYPSTVATISRAIKKDISYFLSLTGDPDTIETKLHDFGFRGVSSVESAALGGVAHLTQFYGTDTMAALELARKHYDCQTAGFSIPATEHSTITSWGKSREVDAIKNFIDKNPDGAIACVCDSFDIFSLCREAIGYKLKPKILTRNGGFVVRPDSGNPKNVVLMLLNILESGFGVSTNSKGFKVLHPSIRLIWGDGIDRQGIYSLLEAMMQSGWSADNISFGMGGGLLQKLNRDTCKYAFKCSAIKRDNRWEDVYKNPITDPGKKSKRGRLALLHDGNEFRTVRSDSEIHPGDCLRTVFLNGEMKHTYKLSEVRETSAKYR